MSKAPGTSGTMPVTGAACGIKPSKEAMEVDFTIDFSQAKQFLQSNKDKPKAGDAPSSPAEHTK